MRWRRRLNFLGAWGASALIDPGLIGGPGAAVDIFHLRRSRDSFQFYSPLLSVAGD